MEKSKVINTSKNVTERDTAVEEELEKDNGVDNDIENEGEDESEKIAEAKDEDEFTPEKLEEAVNRFNDRYTWSEEYGKYIQTKPLVPGGLIPDPSYSRKTKKKKEN